MSTTVAAAQSNSTLAGQLADIAEIAASIGETAYRWQIDSDSLSWSTNACNVLNIPDSAMIASGRAFAGLVAADNTHSRYNAVMNSPLRDGGTGVPYQVQYALTAGPEQAPFWVEDTGRWFAGPDGRPVRAHGMIRVINERHAQQDRLAFLSHCDELTGEMNRRNLAETLSTALEDAIKLRTSFGFLVVSVDDLARVNEAYGFGVGDELIVTCAKRLRAKMRGGDSLGRLYGNKFGVILKESSRPRSAPSWRRGTPRPSKRC
jgi:predicted signal transduction protein with EAL and GGDEF domain